MTAAIANRKRRGLTLLEVVIALAIFLFSLVTLAQLLSMSGERAVEANQRSQANLLCQSKLAEVITGIESLSSNGYSAFPDGADWEWRLDCNESDIPGLWNVQVWVRRDRANGTVLEVSLSQMVLSPAQRGSSQDMKPSTDATSGGTP